MHNRFPGSGKVNNPGNWGASVVPNVGMRNLSGVSNWVQSYWNGRNLQPFEQEVSEMDFPKSPRSFSHSMVVKWSSTWSNVHDEITSNRFTSDPSLCSFMLLFLFSPPFAKLNCDKAKFFNLDWRSTHLLVAFEFFLKGLLNDGSFAEIGLLNPKSGKRWSKWLNRLYLGRHRWINCMGFSICYLPMCISE